ncbi:DUF3786 domain-containing protein [Desulfonema magnum]|uniref:DUF3786 n=1 Tax=Desulfonema magnum TaxID=45655 RepID=A0A975GL02_9BACT|nr:DUF3786 domain-containing protein [Desulfonema magnum]QTA85331.1 DUF3786 [Desulfonema magnum]
MARVDDYLNAKKIAVETLSKASFQELVQHSKFEQVNDNTFRVPFLNRVFLVSFTDFDFQDESEKEKEVPIQEQVLILHYCMGSGNILKLKDKRIAYREIPGASFYFSAFVQRAIDPLKKVFGQNIPGFLKAAEQLNGKKIDIGDAGFEFDLFPKISLQLILWEGDDEFPPEANILFQEGIGEILSPEDVAWLSGMIVYRLMAMGR